MAYLLGVVAFVAALVLSVTLHEAGHLVAAKRFGMKATQFFVGFGPTLWSRRHGETEYGVKAILLGGFVRIVGYTTLEKLDEADRPRAFYLQPARRRAVVIVAGVAANLLLAFVLLVALATVVGVRQAGTATTVVERVSACVPERLGGRCAPGRPPSPARAAGLRSGDRIVSFAGRPVGGWQELRAAIRAAPAGRAVPVVAERDGTRRAFQVRLAEVDGEPFLGVTARVVGVRYDRLGPGEAVVFALKGIAVTVAQMGRALAALPAALPELFSPQRGQSAGGQIGSVVGAGQISGEIFASGGSWRDAAGPYLALVASINVFLGALNVLPLLPLDGGHLAVLGYERLRARIARARGRSDPGPVDITRLLPVTYLAVVLLVGLGVLLIVADLLNPLRLSP
ncbi:M50 family metallopeptidase [Thermomonospora curvata]|uniref:Peptidase M50 n=1 Tax=Thermomonospora curvata (strain ATCC 19995 / DSM 43183 / JCM 3096 / KCTC 9072 / NBRC 15933 / NCIMB 10081 / Henssen B9) TaxID=471852 RepID=D1AAJ6_THECD|nr:site-2 protease family protein [Thermomonospora curvata]ACY98909.1 peptidase M50 [Thermomonospora curvata DSM 43183]